MRAVPELTTSTCFEPQPTAEQFAHVYYSRQTAIEKLMAVPFEGRPEPNIASSSSQIWFVGTIFCHMQNKPNIIKDISLINHGSLPQHSPSYEGATSKKYIQPLQGRPIEIRGDVDELVTGCVVAVQGVLVKGVFEVQEYAFSGFEPVVAPKQKGKIVFLSGLSIESEAPVLPALGILLDYLSGYLSSTCDQLVICGDSLKEPPPELVGSRITRPVLNTGAIFDFVRLISGIARDLPVHLMPGATDPAETVLPQKPFHRGLFASAKSLLESGALTLHTNPAKFSIGPTRLLGTSGQPVADILKYSDKFTAIKTLVQTLEARHLAPTAPDTLPMYPFSSQDPLIIDEVPHVYFAGNMPEYASELVKGVRVICVPSFNTTGQVVELDLETMETSVVEFNA